MATATVDTDARLRDTINELVDETRRVAHAYDLTRAPDRELLAASKAFTNAIGAANDQRSKLTGKDVDIAANVLSRLVAQIEKRTTVTLPSYEYGDQLAHTLSLWRGLAEQDQLPGWTVEDFDPIVGAWRDVPRSVARAKGAVNMPLDFMVALLVDGKEVQRTGIRNGRTFLPGLKERLEKHLGAKIDKTNPQWLGQWRGVRDALNSEGITRVGTVVLKRVDA